MELVMLIALLSDKKWHVRESAHRNIEMRMDVQTYLFLRGCSPSGPEARQRLKRIVLTYEGRVFWPDLRGYGYPFIDSLPKNYPKRDKIMGEYLKETRKYYGCGSWDNDWPEYRYATELWVNDRAKEAIALGRPDSTIQKDIDDMIAGDDIQYKNAKRQNPRRR